jgi:hypothetical protein
MRPARHLLEPAFHDVRKLLHARETDGSSPLFSPGERIVASARRFARSPEECGRFARAAALRSVNPGVEDVPAGESKAAVLVGDALYAAGFAAPTEDHRYLAPERWPGSSLFQPIGRDWTRPGDLLIVGAHVEVITEVFLDQRRITTLGARTMGLVEDRRYGDWLLRARRRGDHFVHARERLQVLRASVQTP